jgi:hypothetical protein
MGPSLSSAAEGSEFDFQVFVVKRCEGCASRQRDLNSLRCNWFVLTYQSRAVARRLFLQLPKRAEDIVTNFRSEF